MTTRNNSKPKRKAKSKKKATAKRKASSKKSQPKKAAKRSSKMPSSSPPKPRGKQVLDRRIYAEARARGAPKCDAAKLAGSKARSKTALTQAGSIVEQDPIVEDLIEAIKAELIIREIADPWEKAKAVMEAMLLHPEWRARGTASNFFAKVVGGYAPDKVEHSGNIETAAAGEIGNLSKAERDEVRKLLQKRKS